MSSNNVSQIPDEVFIKVVSKAINIRQALSELGLVPKGGNYQILRNRCRKLNIQPPDTKQTSRKDTIIRNQITDEQFIEACNKSQSRQQTLRILGLDCFNGQNVRWSIAKLGSLQVNTAHWLGQGHLRGKTHNWGCAQPLNEILVKNSHYTSSYSLKYRLIKSNMLKNECSFCKISTWKDKPLSLHLDHINGCRTDNRLNNLRLLCPNCHSQTDTYCGKNKGKINP